MKWAFLLCLSVMLLGACSGERNPTVTLRFRLAQEDSARLHRAAPDKALNHTCFLLNVDGPGVDRTFDVEDLRGYAHPACIGLGTVSKPLTKQRLLNGFSMQVRAGIDRRVEFLGLEMPGAASCNTKDLNQLLGDQMPELYHIGSTVVDLLSDRTVHIENFYDNETSHLDRIATCLIPRSLPLEKAYVGHFKSSNVEGAFDTDDITQLTLPPKNSAGSFLAPLDFGLGTAAFVAYPAPIIANVEKHVRMDFLFEVTGLSLGAYDHLDIKVLGAGGTSKIAGTSCEESFQAPTQPHGVALSVWNVSTQSWVSPIASNNEGDTESRELKLTVPRTALGISGFYAIAPEETGDGVEAGRRFFHVSVRERLGVVKNSGDCTALQIDRVEAVLR